MELPQDTLRKMLAFEAFIRRAAQSDKPFMLKGSYVTRQYYRDPDNRIPADLDWVYMESLSDAEQAEQIFNDWATTVTETVMDDGVLYTSFREDAFWRSIDYAMADDFPTVSTYLSCQVDGERLHSLDLDISFNLDIEAPAVPLLYMPLQGEPFFIPFTVPLSLQVAWKIHQTLVRPRFKDLLDLIELLQHSSWNKEVLQQSVQALVNECAADQVDTRKLHGLLEGDIGSLFPENTMQKTWEYWRHDGYSDNRAPIFYADTAAQLTDVSRLPEKLPDFLRQLTDAFRAAGWTKDLADNLPQAGRNKRKGYQHPDDVAERTTVAYNDYLLSEERDTVPPPSSKPPGKNRFWRFWYGLFK